MPTGDRKDPYRGYNFLVEIDGVTSAGFRECSGLDTSQDPIEYREGNQPRTVRKLPGLVKYANIVLKRGYAGSDELWNWRKKVVEGHVERRAGSIIVLDDAGQEVKRWNFFEGWPAKWTGPAFNATANEVAIETLEIAHEKLELA
jgi:phage tail-like protein